MGWDKRENGVGWKKKGWDKTKEKMGWGLRENGMAKW